MRNCIKSMPCNLTMLIRWSNVLRSRLDKALQKLWYGRSRIAWLLWPFSLILIGVSRLRRLWLEAKRGTISVPIIVVGNISVGGVGKTPLVIALAQHLLAKGLRVGIVSRGYGAKISAFPHEVSEDDQAHDVGDEPKLLAIKTHCPVVIAPIRMQAVSYLLEKHHSQVIISDDGLQHYAMARTIEIVVVDGMRGFGNGFCMPAGPLRELPKRLREVDFIVINGTMTADIEHSISTHITKDQRVDKMDIIPGCPISLRSHRAIAWSDLNMPLSAVAAIGHPERFFNVLDQFGLVYQRHVFSDHHVFLAKELDSLPKPVIMTEKDAVKCCTFETESTYCVPVEAKLSEDFWITLWSLLAEADRCHAGEFQL